MFCEKCGKNISADSAFCEFCGHKIEKEEEASNITLETPPKEQKKEKNFIISNTLKQMANHLEFLGYKIEKNEPSEGENRESIFAVRQGNLNLTILEMMPGFILFRTGLATKKKPSAKIDAFLNDTNKNFLISKVYREIENEIVIIRLESVYIGDYVKDTFIRFMDINIKEHNQLQTADDFSKLFVD